VLADNHAGTQSSPFRHILGFWSHCIRPMGGLETGLRVCPSEKKAAKLGYNFQRDTFSGPVSGRVPQNCGGFSQFCRECSRVSLQPRLCGGEIEIRTFVTFCAEALRTDVCATCNGFCKIMSHPENWFKHSNQGKQSLFLFRRMANA
jgi:hypothetical protein